MTASPDPVRPGELITYRLTVTNSGTADLAGVVLKARVPDHIADCIGFYCNEGDAVTWSLGTLLAGASRTEEMVVKVSSGSYAPPNGTLLRNSAVVTDNGGGSATVERSVVVDATPVLTLGMAADREPVEPGGLLTYTLTFGNRGSVNAPGVELSTTLPAGTTFVSASSGGTVTGGVVSWSLGTVSAGESGQRQFTVAVDGRAADGSLLFSEAEIRDTASPEDNARAAAATAVRSAPPLTLRMTSSPDPVRPGELITYRLTVTNSETADLAGVVLKARVPDYIGDCIGFYCNEGDAVTWSLGTLLAGASRTEEMVVKVSSGSSSAPPNGTLLRNSARVFHPGEGFIAVDDTYTRVCTGGGTTCDHIPPPLPLLTVTKSGTGSGTVTSSPAGISCGTDCSESYTSGTVVTLTASLDLGSTFCGLGRGLLGDGRLHCHHGCRKICNGHL